MFDFLIRLDRAGIPLGPLATFCLYRPAGGRKLHAASGCRTLRTSPTGTDDVVPAQVGELDWAGVCTTCLPRNSPDVCQPHQRTYLADAATAAPAVLAARAALAVAAGQTEAWEPAARHGLDPREHLPRAKSPDVPETWVEDPAAALDIPVRVALLERSRRLIVAAETSLRQRCRNPRDGVPGALRPAAERHRLDTRHPWANCPVRDGDLCGPAPTGVLDLLAELAEQLTGARDVLAADPAGLAQLLAQARAAAVHATARLDLHAVRGADPCRDCRYPRVDLRPLGDVHTQGQMLTAAFSAWINALYRGQDVAAANEAALAVVEASHVAPRSMAQLAGITGTDVPYAGGPVTDWLDQVWRQHRRTLVGQILDQWAAALPAPAGEGEDLYGVLLSTATLWDGVLALNVAVRWPRVLVGRDAGGLQLQPEWLMAVPGPVATWLVRKHAATMAPQRLAGVTRDSAAGVLHLAATLHAEQPGEVLEHTQHAAALITA